MSDWSKELLNGEEVQLETEKHWASPVADSWQAVLLILASFVVAWLQTDQTAGVMGFVNRVLNLLELGLFLGGVGWIGYNIIAWRTAKYAVTNMRVLGHEGLLRSRNTDTLLTSVTDVRTKMSAVGKSLGYGDISIMGSSGEAGQDTLTSIRKVDEFKRKILELKTSDSAKTAATATASAGATTQASVTATLAELAKLRDSGAITPAEYEAKKADLLSRI
jgi:uncharacterized membrane protein YdbT with pleckstrin-like domain